MHYTQAVWLCCGCKTALILSVLLRTIYFLPLVFLPFLLLSVCSLNLCWDQVPHPLMWSIWTTRRSPLCIWHCCWVSQVTSPQWFSCILLCVFLSQSCTSHCFLCFYMMSSHCVHFTWGVCMVLHDVFTHTVLDVFTCTVCGVSMCIHREFVLTNLQVFYFLLLVSFT